VTPLSFQTWSFIVSLEAPLRPLYLGVAYDFGWWTVYRRSTFLFFCFLLSYLSQCNYTFVMCSSSFFFNFSANVFYGLFLSLTLLQKFCMFSIQSFNYNLSYIIIFNLILILLISHFNSLLFCQSFNCFLFCHSIKVYALLFQFSPHSFDFFFPFFFQFNRPINFIFL